MKTKNFLQSLILLFVMVGLQTVDAQVGAIKYKETVKLDIKMDGPGHGGVDMSKYLPESTTFYRELHFNETASVYHNDKDGEPTEPTEISSDDGSFKMVLKMDSDHEEIIYTNLNDKKVVELTGFMGKGFVIKEDLANIKWKITGEKVMYLDFECTKATATIDDKSIVAWFAPQIPAQVGPANYGRLPGAILMVSVDDGKTEIMATEVMQGEQDYKIEAPKDGKKVTREQYEKIVEEKMKEMKETSGGDRIIIRG